jgi:hypothetical protein
MLVSSTDTDPPQTTPKTPRDVGPVTALLWAIGVLMLPMLFQERYDRVLHSKIMGFDYRIFYQAATQVWFGHNPYSVRGYTYTPLLSAVMAPFFHTRVYGIEFRHWQTWTTVELIGLAIAIAVFVASEAYGRAAWQVPVIFIFVTLTSLHFWPITRILILGQVDIFVLILLLCSAWAQSRRKPGTRAVFLGLAVVLKVWPVVDGVVMLQRGLANRARAMIAFAITVCAAPILILGFGGSSGLHTFVSSTSAQRSYDLVSHSLWGTASLLFSRTGLAQPLYVSNGLRIGLICVLLPWVVGLILLTLWTPGDTTMCLWNIAGCMVLVIPMVHLAYSIFLLPLLWVWGGRLLQRDERSAVSVTVFGVMVGWWLIQSQAWPDDGWSARNPAWRFCVIFAVNLIACTASVLGNWVIQRRNVPATTARMRRNRSTSHADQTAAHDADPDAMPAA